MGLCNYMN
jgi:phage N-6-adenine-methyltransferase